MRLAVWALAGFAVGSAPAQAQLLSVRLEKPSRDFGILLGDALTAAAIVDVGSGTVLDTASLPVAGPVASTLDVRSVAVATTALMHGTRYTVRVTYQNFASPEHVATVDVPGYTLALSRGNTRLAANVRGFSFSVSPFRNDVTPVLDGSALRPDQVITPVDLDRATWLFGAGVFMSLAGGLSLLFLRAPLLRFGRRGLPFASAWRELTALRRRDAGGPNGNRGVARENGVVDTTQIETQRDGFLILHRAFDATAGTRVFADDLDGFFRRFSWTAPWRRDVEKFFASSRSLFFGAADSEMTMEDAEVTRLARDLMRAERRG
jgi:mxaA protein